MLVGHRFGPGLRCNRSCPTSEATLLDVSVSPNKMQFPDCDSRVVVNASLLIPHPDRICELVMVQDKVGPLIDTQLTNNSVAVVEDEHVVVEDVSLDVGRDLGS